MNSPSISSSHLPSKIQESSNVTIITALGSGKVPSHTGLILSSQLKQPIVGPPTITKAPLGMDDVQPVDLVSVKKMGSQHQTHLKIPVIQSRPTFRQQPQMHSPSSRGVTSLNVPKPSPIIQVVQPTNNSNRVTLLQTTSLAKSVPFVTGLPSSQLPHQLTSPRQNSPRASSASNIIRGLSPVSTFIRSPSGVTTQSVRLSGTQASNAVQFVPVSLSPNHVRSLGPIAVRPALSRQEASASPVRVTIVQQQHSQVPKIVQPVQVAQTSALFKPLNLSSQSSPPSASVHSGSVRISTVTNPRMTIIPSTTFSMTLGTPVNPINATAHGIITSKPVIQQSLTPPRLPGNVSVPVVTSSAGAATIHKTTIGINNSPKDVNLPLGLSPSSLPSISHSLANTKPLVQTVPVARLSSSSLSGLNFNNLMTHAPMGTSAKDGGILLTRSSSTQPTQQIAFNLLATPTQLTASSQDTKIRPAQPVAQLTAINLSTTGGSKGSNSHKLRPVNATNLHKIGMPSQLARLVDFPQTLASISTPPSNLERQNAKDECLPVNLVREPNRPDTQVSDSLGASNSAPSSPDIQPADLICNEELHSPNKVNGGSIEPSPRKKPRKQQLGLVQEPNWNENDDPMMAKDLKHKVPLPRVEPNFSEELFHETLKNGEDDNESNRGKLRPVLMDDNRYLWNCRITHHFAHESEVRARDERKPTVNDLVNQKGVFQKIEGWKILYLTSQMVDIIDDEHDLTLKLEDFQRRLSKAAHPELIGKDLVRVDELIKANVQRGKVIQDQITEAKGSVLEIFDYKPKVVSIICKYESKRSVRHRPDL